MIVLPGASYAFDYWYSEDVKATAEQSEVLADTGGLYEGIYDIEVYQYLNSDAAHRGRLEHRNAANDATLHRQLFVMSRLVSPISFQMKGVIVQEGERFRVVAAIAFAVLSQVTIRVIQRYET